MCGVCVGTLLCVVALGVKTSFILCMEFVLKLCFVVWLLVKRLHYCVWGLCWDVVLCCGSLCKEPIYFVRCVGTLFFAVALGVETIFIVCGFVLGPCFVLRLFV